MNSYEIEQPLDLRLKALNLSLNPFHHSTSSITSNSSTSNDSIKSIGINGSGGQTTNAAHLVGLPAHNQAHQMSSSLSHHHHQYHPHQLMNAHNHHYHQQKHLPSLPISIASQPLQTINQGQQQSHCHEPSAPAATSPQQQHHSHLRSANIHCQPLNHHQPHPLSRLHPIPSHLQPIPGQGQHQQQQLQQSQQQQQVAVAPTATSAHQQPLTAVSHHYNPPRQFSSPQHNFYNYPMPVRSLSMSNYHHQHYPNSAALFAQQPSGAPTLTAAIGSKQASAQINQSENNIPSKQTSDTSSLNNGSSFLKELTANTPTTQIVNNNNNNNRKSSSSSSSPPTTSSNSSPTNSSLVLANSSTRSASNSSNQTVNDNNSNSAPQITRQLSLVGRYTCQPCQISFSQIENLRAHQEGYCTKRDRTQTPQVRSQSAVSPVAASNQQQQQQNQTTSPLAPPNQLVAAQR